jgi:hypothetical protein
MCAWIVFFALILVFIIKKQVTGNFDLLMAAVATAVGSIALVSAVIARIWS